jgi:uncharacterized membrane protein YagU involved in acid resistance
MTRTSGPRASWARARSGAFDGVVATAAMSAVMAAATAAGALGEPPPAKVTGKALEAADAAPVSGRALGVLSIGTHASFGACLGALFEAVVAPRVTRAPTIAGAAFGLLVWIGSYAGWMPALGIIPPPHRDRSGRPTAMILSHLVYGGVLGALAARRA